MGLQPTAWVKFLKQLDRQDDRTYHLKKMSEDERAQVVAAMSGAPPPPLPPYPKIGSAAPTGGTKGRDASSSDDSSDERGPGPGPELGGGGIASVNPFGDAPVVLPKRTKKNSGDSDDDDEPGRRKPSKKKDWDASSSEDDDDDGDLNKKFKGGLGSIDRVKEERVRREKEKEKEKAERRRRKAEKETRAREALNAAHRNAALAAAAEAQMAAAMASKAAGKAKKASVGDSRGGGRRPPEVSFDAPPRAVLRPAAPAASVDRPEQVLRVRESRAGPPGRAAPAGRRPRGLPERRDGVVGRVERLELADERVRNRSFGFDVLHVRIRQVLALRHPKINGG